MLIEDYGAQKYLQSFPGAFEPLSGKVDYKRLCALQGRARHGRRQDLLAALRLRRHRPVLPQRLSRRRPASTPRRCRTSPGTSSSRSARPSRKRPATRCSASTSTTPASSASCCSRPASGTSRPMATRHRRQPDLQGGARDLCQAPAVDRHLQARRRLERIYRRLHVGRNRRSHYRRVDDRDHQGRPTSPASGASPRSRSSRTSKARRTPPTSAVRAGTSSRPRRRRTTAVDFLAEIWGKDVDFYQKILVDQGALGTLLAAREGEAYKARDEYFGGQPVWQNFSDWLAAVPAVNYGIFTNEVDAAIVAQAACPRQGRLGRRRHRRPSTHR